jgi:Nif-specific regulatory protein
VADAQRHDLALSGRSELIREVGERIARAAPSEATVLITGETGTGKERVATLLHEGSPRRQRPMVRVNCAALPEALLESELFGHERGAFTGAEQRRIGRFEEADGGTLFLDEIGDMHLQTQAKLLRALQEREFQRLGGTGTIRVDVRLLSATNQNLERAIEAGSFRADLFYRLNVVPIALPPLRDRCADVPDLVRELLREILGSSTLPRVMPAAEARLVAHGWPGNVRELRNVLERAVLLSGGGPIEVADLDIAVRGSARRTSAASSGGPPALVNLPPEGVDHREVEREMLVTALERCGWVQRSAANLLRMSPRRLNYRIRRLGIRHPSWPANRGAAVATLHGDSDLS